MPVWTRIADLIDTDGRAALVSVVAVDGSAPREAGAHMVVRADGDFSGTIGGGALEHRMLEAARQALAETGARPQGQRLRQALGPDLGQCCGGRVDVRIEVFSRADVPWIRPLVLAEQTRAGIETLGLPDAQGRLIRRLAGRSEPPPRLGEIAERFGEMPTPLYLFGAGHVGRALVLALAPLAFRIEWIDPRAEAFPAMAPANVAMWQLPDPTAALAEAPAGSLVAIMSHSHPLDLAIAAKALPDPRFAYVGMIGSAAKRRRFTGVMQRMGIDAALTGRLVLPIGGRRLAGKAPAVIAAQIAVELLEAREALQAL